MPSCTQIGRARRWRRTSSMTRRDVARLAEHVDDVGHLRQRGEVGVGLLAEDLVGVRVDEVDAVVARLLQVGADEVARARRVRRGADDRDATSRARRMRQALLGVGPDPGALRLQQLRERRVRRQRRSSARSTADVVTVVGRSVMRRGGHASPFVAAVERLVEVVDDVVDVLDADADAHDARQHARVDELLLGELRVGRRRRGG